MTLVDNTLYKVAEIVVSVLIILLSIYLICYFASYRKQSPYKYIPVIWELFLIIIILISQISLTIVSLLHIFYKNHTINIKLFRAILIYYFNIMLLLSLIARSHCLSECWKFNDRYLTRKFSNDSILHEEAIRFEIDYYKKKFDFKGIFALFFGLFTLLFLSFFLVCAYASDDKVDWKSIVYYIIKQINEDSFKPEDKFHAGAIFPLALYFIIYCIVFFYIAKLYFYPLKRDSFLIRFEIVGMFIISLLYIDVLPLIFVFLDKKVSYEVYFLIDSAYFLVILIHYSIITFIRHKRYIDKEQTYTKNDFIQFMQIPSNIEVFKDYLTRKTPEIKNLLPFYYDYLLFKDFAAKGKENINQMNKGKKSEASSKKDSGIISKEEQLVNNYHDELKEKAKKIYKDYFSNLNMSNTSNFSDIDIDFPIDVQDKIIDVFKNNFEVDGLDLIYDESFAWVQNQLQKSFVEFTKKNDEMTKMKKILFFIETFYIIC